MLKYLATKGTTFVVAKVEETNGVQLYTLATTNGHVTNFKNVLLGVEPTSEDVPFQVQAAVLQPQAALGNVNNLKLFRCSYFCRCTLLI